MFVLSKIEKNNDFNSIFILKLRNHEKNFEAIQKLNIMRVQTMFNYLAHFNVMSNLIYQSK